MRKCFMFCIIALMIASAVYAVDFAPLVMEVDVPDNVTYAFDGSNVEIPLNVAGIGGAFWLVVTTKDQGEAIGRVQNGKLGWHTVNMIDTTVYVSARTTRGTGDSQITWDGMSDERNGGGQVPPGTYNFYVYGYDDASDRQLATAYIGGSPPWDGTYTYPIENDTNGTPLANPMMVGTRVWYTCNDADPLFQTGVHYKWQLGSDPNDAASLQTTRCAIYTNRADIYGETAIMHGPAVFHPQDTDIFYHCPIRIASATASLYKWAFVPDGQAIIDENFGGFDNISWDELDFTIGAWTCPAGCYTDGSNIFINASNSEGVYNESAWNVIRIVDFEGDILVDEGQIPDYFMPDDQGPQGKNNCQIRDLWATATNTIFMLPTGCCLHEIVNAGSMLDGADPELVYSNGNGDFFMDIQWRDSDVAPWACLNNAEYTEQRTNSICIDKNGFGFIDTEYGGLTSGGVECPDGFSIGMIKWNDATVDGAHHKSGTTLIDSGSSFDGYYTGAPAQPNGDTNWQSYNVPELYFIATDSDAGVISSEVAVEEDAATAFAVDQNSPNPFNPTTSIGFTIPEAGNVTVEVFNVAGQKIDTLVDDVMNAGHHNVTWDASSVANGVYFYTVQAGEFNKTMKMTLLK